MAGFDASGEAGGTGLSKHIRSRGISETYDLAGFGEGQTKDLVRDAFGQPIPATEPLRFTFLIGGGKTQNRQKYDSDLGRYLAAALREVGYREDRAATALLECQGTYKSQHDTHKGIRTVQVFPKVEIIEADGEDGKGRKHASMTSSPDYMAAVCTFETFQEMVQEKVTSWSQKRRLLRHLDSFVARQKESEQKLTRMETLSAEEEDIYENVDVDVAAQKISWLTSLVKAMVENGQLTKAEHEQVLTQVATKLDALQAEHAAATEKNDEAKLARIHKQGEQLTLRRAMVHANAPITHKVKHQDELRAITAKLIKIEKLESTRGRLLTIDEVKQVGAKDELLERAGVLEADSRGWFEEDEEFEARLNEVRKQGQRMAAKKGPAGGKGGKGASAPISSAGSGKSRGRSGGGAGGSLAMDSDGWNKVKRPRYSINKPANEDRLIIRSKEGRVD
eukprot:jgi/Undpi1/12924/HiC_scaffold_7.g02590.m1